MQPRKLSVRQAATPGECDQGLGVGRCDVVIKMLVEDKEVTLQSQILRVEGSARLERELSDRGCSVEWSM